MVRGFSRFRPHPIELEDGRRRNIDSLVFANIPEMAKYAKLSDGGTPDDGRFEVITERRTGKLRVLATAIRAATRVLGPQPSTTHYAFTALAPMPLQLDGELMALHASTPLAVDIAPSALATVFDRPRRAKTAAPRREQGRRGPRHDRRVRAGAGDAGGRGGGQQHQRGADRRPELRAGVDHAGRGGPELLGDVRAQRGRRDGRQPQPHPGDGHAGPDEDGGGRREQRHGDAHADERQPGRGDPLPGPAHDQPGGDGRAGDHRRAQRQQRGGGLQRRAAQGRLEVERDQRGDAAGRRRVDERPARAALHLRPAEQRRGQQRRRGTPVHGHEGQAMTTAAPTEERTGEPVAVLAEQRRPDHEEHDGRGEQRRAAPR